MRGWRSLGRDSKDAIMWYSSNTELLPACSEPSGARSCNCLDLGQDVQHCTLELYLEATASKQIIAKMYPPHIRERLLHHERSKLDGSGRRRRGTIEEVEMNKESCKISKSHDAIRQRIQEFIRRHSSKADALEVVHSQEGVENVLLDSVPIADGFKDTSIMFADISSFTYWSSQHSPIEVFTLLESLFFEFDRIANDMGVYKLSTVGDCYIASAGVPYPRKDHAIVLTQFAERCRLKANSVNQLAY